MRGLLQSSTGCRMPLARYGRAAGVKGRNPVKIGLEGPQAIWTSRSLKAGLSMPRLFLVALVQLVPLEMWGQEFLGQLLLCTCILTGTWLFLQYPACLPCCNTFNFLSWMCVRMSYFFFSGSFHSLRSLVLKAFPRELFLCYSPALGSHLLPCPCSPSQGLPGWSVTPRHPFPALCESSVQPQPCTLHVKLSHCPK